MALIDYKITTSEIVNNNVKSAPDKLSGTATQNKNVFDKLVELICSKVNGIVDSITYLNPITGISQSLVGSETRIPTDKAVYEALKNVSGGGGGGSIDLTKILVVPKGVQVGEDNINNGFLFSTTQGEVSLSSQTETIKNKIIIDTSGIKYINELTDGENVTTNTYNIWNSGNLKLNDNLASGADVIWSADKILALLAETISEEDVMALISTSIQAAIYDSWNTGV